MESKTVKINECGELMFVTFPKLSSCKVARHIFSSRKGGVSEGQYASMNLSFSGGDKRENVLENYNRLCSAAGIDTSHLVLTHQTHTNNVRVVTREDLGRGISREGFTDVDGLITNQSGVALVTHFADCTPLLFCDAKKHVCATAHSGWKGTVAQIGAVTVQKMVREFGCEPRDIIAAIGPSIGACCYEVDTPVYNAFLESGINLQGVFTPLADGEHFMLDLKRANKNILISAGVLEENIDVADICTCCSSDDFHSHRATAGKRGTLGAIIELI